MSESLLKLRKLIDKIYQFDRLLLFVEMTAQIYRIPEITIYGMIRIDREG